MCYTPRSLASKSILAKRIKAFQEVRMTNHWPHKPKLFPINPRTYGAKLKKDNSVESVLAKTMKETMHRGITNFREKVDDTTCILCFL